MKIIIVTETRVIFDAVRINLLYVDEVKHVVLANRIGEAFVKMSSQIFDVCLLDLDLPGALIVMPELNEYWPAMRVVSLGGERINTSIMADVRVEILKRQASVNEIAELLTTRTAQRDVRLSLPPMETSIETRPDPIHLSLRENEIAALLAQGMSNKSIARQLSIQPSTVKNHVHNILDKLEVSNRAKVAGRMGMLRPTSA